MGVEFSQGLHSKVHAPDMVPRWRIGRVPQIRHPKSFFHNAFVFNIRL